MLISDAYADAPSATGSTTAPASSTSASASYDGSSPFSGVWVIILVSLIMYVLMIRPNQKKIKDYEEMVKSLRRGDRIVTGGGVIGVITKVENDDVLVVEIAPEIKVRVMRETISHVINKTAVNDNKADDKSAKKADDKASGN